MEWNFRNDLPIYTQLMEQLSRAIVSGELLPGAKLPSVRDMAMDAGVNPNTVQRALADLEREGLVFSQRTSGRYVTDDEALIGERKEAMAEEIARQFVDSISSLGLDKEEIIKVIERVRGK